jgi:dipeptidase E
MIKTIIAIGGGEIGRIKVYEDGHSEQKPIETMVIDKKIIELTGKTQPKLVFIGAASGDDPRYFKAVSDHFGSRLGCHTENLVLTDSTKIPNIEAIRKIILGADIIYVGGGNVTDLMTSLRKTGADKVLIEAYNNGIIMSGNSAGGCVWYEFYDNEEDSDFNINNPETLTTKRALGLISGYFVPHWNTKSKNEDVEGSVSRNSINKMLTKENKWGYAVDEGAAIMVQTDGDKQIMTNIISRPGAGVYKLNQDIQNIRPDNNIQR